MSRLKPGWTLAELLVSLALLGGVMGIAAHFAVSQLRFFQAATEVVSLKAKLSQAGQIVGALARSVSPADGDILAATDTALEILAPVGTAIVCDATPGSILVPAPSSLRGNTFGAYYATPDAGDRIGAFLDDSLGTTWMTLMVAQPPASAGLCPTLGVPAWRLMTREPFALSFGVPVRILRPLRISFYKSSDSKWYLGAKDWNGASGQFNGIQPVLGPFSPFNRDAERSGLRFVYRDRDGLELNEPIDTRRIAAIVVVSRAGTERPILLVGTAASLPKSFEDTSSTTVALRNAR